MRSISATASGEVTRSSSSVSTKRRTDSWWVSRARMSARAGVRRGGPREGGPGCGGGGGGGVGAEQRRGWRGRPPLGARLEVVLVAGGEVARAVVVQPDGRRARPSRPLDGAGERPADEL